MYVCVYINHKNVDTWAKNKMQIADELRKDELKVSCSLYTG